MILDLILRLWWPKFLKSLFQSVFHCLWKSEIILNLYLGKIFWEVRSWHVLAWIPNIQLFPFDKLLTEMFHWIWWALLYWRISCQNISFLSQGQLKWSIGALASISLISSIQQDGNFTHCTLKKLLNIY